MYNDQEWAGLQQTLLLECQELQAELEGGLLRLERQPTDHEAIHAIFRAVHTIKGSAGLFDMDRLVAFAHLMESLLVALREGDAPQPGLIAGLLGASDVLALMVERIVGQGEDLTADEELQARQAETELRHFLAEGGQIQTIAKPAATLTREVPVHDDCWHISLRFGPDTFRNGFDPLAVLAYLESLGTLASVTCLVEQIPALGQLDPETCHWGYELQLQTTADRAQLLQALEFVADDCRFVLLPPDSRIEEYLAFIHSLPDEELRLGEILVACGVLTEAELQAALSRQDDLPTHPPLGEIVQEAGVSAAVVDSALNKQSQARETRQRDGKTVRVQADKLDSLIDRVGELVIAGASAGVLAAHAGAQPVIEALTRVAELVEAIRDDALSLRMVEISEVFNRFPRIVRDVSRELNKDIELVISGGDTELDKTFVEKIGDPLTHLIRNAIDHGIEEMPVRLAHHKPAQGQVHLNAYHQGSAMVIEVSDDGGGLCTAAIRDKGQALGLVAPGAVLSDAEIHQLIFAPGFSTAAQVTNLSGRGVGMDVVKRSIENLRGSIEILNAPGQGCTFRIRLPLTLAIIDGFLVTVGSASLVIPLDQVLECLEWPRQAHSSYLNLRNEILPLLNLRQLLGLQGAPSNRRSIVVVAAGASKAGLIVDGLLGEQQTVIKPLGRMFRQLNVISGSTILGSGEVALILDVLSLIQTAERQEKVESQNPQLEHQNKTTFERTEAC